LAALAAFLEASVILGETAHAVKPQPLAVRVEIPID
jgi:hypothetical protein